MSRPELVKAATLKRVRKAIDELGYEPSQAAQSLRTRSSRAIGYRLFPADRSGTGGVLDTYLFALSVAAHRAGFALLCNAADSDEDEIALFGELRRRQVVDGFVITATRYNDVRIPWLLDTGTAFVSFGRPWGLDMSSHTWMDIDGASGTRQAVDHLVEQGHRRIAFLGWSAPDGISEDREAGWRRACGTHDLPTTGLTRHGTDAVATGLRLARELLDETEAPTAFVSCSDTIAVGVLREVLARNLTPGKDIAVVGFDDSVGSRLVLPNLTSVTQPLEEAAAQTLRLLLRVIESPGARPEQVLLRPALRIRESSIREPFAAKAA